MTPDMHVSLIRLQNFRNYASASVALDGRHVVLTGSNGAGKTNLMEAVSLLSPGRGLRRAQLTAMTAKCAADGFSVFARIERDEETFDIGTGTAGQDGDTVQRKVRINQTSASADELAELIRVSWLTPAMDGLFTGPAGDRRRFLDRMVLAIDPAHGRRASDYEKAMRNRNRLLDERPGNATDAWLDAAESQLASLGTAIIAARTELVGLMAALITKGAKAQESPFPTAHLLLDGDYEAMARTGVAGVELEEEMVRELRDMRHRDRAAGRTLTGPHRADLMVRHQEKDIEAGLCSTGEQKALLIGLVLAHAGLTRSVCGMAPVMLMDEVAAHLDPARRAALFDRIHAIGGQAFMTGTDRSLFDALGDRAQYFSVSQGTVNAEDGI